LCGNRRRFTTHDLKTIFMVPCNGSSLSVWGTDGSFSL
jgi:hypothetical protein